MHNLNGSNSWCSSINETRDSSERKPAFIKHFLIVDSDTFHQTWAIYLIAWSKSTDLDTSVAELQSSILLITCVSINLVYFILNAWITQRSRGWSLDVQFGGKNTIFMWSYVPFISGGWQGTLSRNKITFLCSCANFLIKLGYQVWAEQVRHIPDSEETQIFWLINNNQFFFTARCMILSLDFFPPIHCFDTRVRDLSGSARKNWPVLSMLKMFSGEKPLKIFAKALAKMLQACPGCPKHRLCGSMDSLPLPSSLSWVKLWL